MAAYFLQHFMNILTETLNSQLKLKENMPSSIAARSILPFVFQSFPTSFEKLFTTAICLKRKFLARIFKHKLRVLLVVKLNVLWKQSQVYNFVILVVQTVSLVYMVSSIHTTSIKSLCMCLCGIPPVLLLPRFLWLNPC